MTLDGLPLVLANGVGVVGVVLIVGWLVWTGRLVPKSTHEAHVALLAERIADATQRVEDSAHEADQWRTEARIKDEQIQVYGENARAMQVGFETLADFLAGLRRAGIGAALEDGDFE